MNATQLLKTIHQGNALEKEDFRALIKLHETFPYFLVPKILAAKYEQNISKGESKELLHWAAVQSPDRAWLKQLIEEDITFLGEKNTVSNDTDEAAPAMDADQGNEDNNHQEETATTSQTPAEEDPTAAPKSNKSRGDILKQLEENLTQLKNQDTKSGKTKDKEGEKDNPKPKSTPGEDLIESIRKKEKKSIKDHRKKEQIDIIQSFSKKDIKLAAIKENEDDSKQKDLSEGSTQLKDTLLSESYARLLTKQGKKEKAIEIYEKLILKFPKKKAYFADLINELKA